MKIVIVVCLVIGFELAIFLGSWAKVSKGKKPLGWWRYKFLCELGYFLEKNFNSTYGMKMYYGNLNKMCRKYNLNLYGDKF